MEAARVRNSIPRERTVPFVGFVVAVVTLAAGVVAQPLVQLPADLPHLPAAFWVMAVLATVSDSRPFTPPGVRRSAAVFPSICFTFAIMLAWGLAPAVAVQAGAVAVSAWRMG